MNLVYREPINASELASVFRLRHAAYTNDERLHTMVPASATIDVNEFDLNALHFAAFDGQKVIACIRISTNSETHFSTWVKELAANHNVVLTRPDTLFPFQHYYPSPEWGLSFLKSLNGRKIGEVGKLAIDKNYRKGGLVLNGLVSSFVDYCKNDQKFNTGFGICTHELERYYRKFGFSIVEGSIPFIYDRLPEAVLVRFDN